MFKTIPGFPDYKINEFGDVISHKRKNELLRAHIFIEGRPCMSLSDKRCIIKTTTINKLVGSVFVPNPNEYFHCIRIDPTRPASPSNLFWHNAPIFAKAICQIGDDFMPVKMWNSLNEAKEYFFVSRSSMYYRITKHIDGLWYFDDYIDLLISNAKYTSPSMKGR